MWQKSEDVFQCCKEPPSVMQRLTSDDDIIECWVECKNCKIEGFRNPLMWEAIKEWNDMLYWCDIIFNDSKVQEGK